MGPDDDKTIFNPDGNGFREDPNATIMIPNPGRRLRAEADGVPNGPTPPEQPRPQVASSSLTPIKINLKAQDNVFLSASSTLITVLSAVSNSLSHPNIAQLQQEMSTEIGQFDARLSRAGVRSEEALSARYVLCSAIDEAIMNTPWGVESGWGQRSLLRIYHSEAMGGERFFALLEQLQANTAQFRDLLELFYVLLSMGFQGKYRLDGAGDSRLESIRERLYQDLYSNRPYERNLSPATVVASAAKSSLRSQIPLWVVLSVSLAVALLAYTGLRAWMYSGSLDISKSFDAIYAEQTPDS